MMEESRFLACKHGTLGGYCGLCAHESRERYAALQHPATVEKIATLTTRVRELEAVLRAVDSWDLNWADGLDSNVERIKAMVRAALGE